MTTHPLELNDICSGGDTRAAFPVLWLSSNIQIDFIILGVLTIIPI
jgi:hypothetical protein